MAQIYDLSRISLLLVEDNEFMAGLLTSMLTAMRFGKIMRAPDGQRAMEMIEQHAAVAAHPGHGIDIIISDWQMEPVDGMALLRWVRSQPGDHIRFLPFIMLTAFPERERVLQARDAGASEFLRKPVTVGSVISRIIEVIDRPRPFVKCATFFGPDRRRRNEPVVGKDRRALTSDAAEPPQKMIATG